MCSCESTPDRYFISYGKQYCERFLGATDWSQAGRIWRDKTLICLQEAIVPQLPKDGQTCNCSAMKGLAFQAHVHCYTQSDASICDLGRDDWLKIAKLAGGKDLFSDADGQKQMLEVLRICAISRVDSAARDVWQNLKTLLGN
jgi:hypothetical protein